VTLDKLEPVSCRLQIELVIFWNKLKSSMLVVMINAVIGLIIFSVNFSECINVLVARTFCSVFHLCPLLFFCLALGISSSMSSSPPVAGERILFSNVARFGFAAGHDSPALKIEENVPLQNNMPGNNSSNLNGITFSWNFVALSLSLSLSLSYFSG